MRFTSRIAGTSDLYETYGLKRRMQARREAHLAETNPLGGQQWICMRQMKAAS
jgi:hypothetical protein